ncbi:MAG: hypothetical protein ACRBCT_02585 [Alphaproteobacteria bacterium]
MKIKYFVSVFGVLGLCSASALAGFEWVPVTKRERPTPAPVFTPGPLFTPAPVSAPIARPAPASAPVATPMQDAPIILKQPLPAPEQQKELFIPRVRTTPQPAAMVELSHAPKPKPWEVNTIEDIDLTQPPSDLDIPAPMPRIILPVDAPQSADANLGNTERLTITAYPVPADQTEPKGSFDAMALAPVAAPAPDVSDFAVVNGFGSDLPLALALGQIVPADYTYSFAAGVNPGAFISWSGNGKPWNEVLSDTLMPLGYGIQIRGNKVVITTS